MQISRNIVQKVIMGVRAIACVKKHLTTFYKPSIHYACLRLCSATVDLTETIVFILSAKADQRKRLRHWLH